MFGSNFFANFGIPDFPYQGADAQGGYLANSVPNDPLGQNNPQMPSAAPSAGPLNGSQLAGAPAATPPAAAPSPLGGGPLAPGGAPTTPQQPSANPEPAPAAGVGSPFAKIGGA